jgi:hypothetical protein
MSVNQQDIYELIMSQIGRNLKVSPLNGGFKVTLPFQDYMGEPIEMLVVSSLDQVMLEDLGHSAGILFSLGLHSEENPAHQLIKNLSDSYHIIMDYDSGVLRQRVSSNVDDSEILDFMKVLISVQTVIPELQRRRIERRVGRRLATRLGEVVKQLRLPVEVQRQVDVEGKHETWQVDYRYVRNHGPETVDVLILAADLNVKEPRKSAEHALTLAVDVLAFKDKRELRIVYDIDGNGSSAAAQRAAMLIDDYQRLAGFRAYNFASLEDKAQLMAQIVQELSPLTRE